MIESSENERTSKVGTERFNSHIGHLYILNQSSHTSSILSSKIRGSSELTDYDAAALLRASTRVGGIQSPIASRSYPRTTEPIETYCIVEHFHKLTEAEQDLSVSELRRATRPPRVCDILYLCGESSAECGGSRHRYEDGWGAS